MVEFRKYFAFSVISSASRLSGPYPTTGREWLIRSHSSATFCFELSEKINYNMRLLLDPFIFDEVIIRFEEKPRIKGKFEITMIELTVSDL